jgi:hypothetical protein
MLSNAFTHFNDISLMVFGLILFVVTFAGITVWTFFRKGSKEYYRIESEMPLSSEEKINERR